jgi:hypothetical protein
MRFSLFSNESALFLDPPEKLPLIGSRLFLLWNIALYPLDALYELYMGVISPSEIGWIRNFAVIGFALAALSGSLLYFEHPNFGLVTGAVYLITGVLYCFYMLVIGIIPFNND